MRTCAFNFLTVAIHVDIHFTERTLLVFKDVHLRLKNYDVIRNGQVFVTKQCVAKNLRLDGAS